jgi:hypothetical protein
MTPKLPLYPWIIQKQVWFRSIGSKYSLSGSHVSPVLPTDIEQRIRDLTQAGDLHGLYQFQEDATAFVSVVGTISISETSIREYIHSEAVVELTNSANDFALS